ncbi:VOC family protein [soil metagenome]
MSANPLAMFEIMACQQETLISFYSELFGWKVQRNSEGFAYIHFPPPPPGGYPVLGGIGQAKTGVPGYEKGTAFYIQVTSVAETLQTVVRMGGVIVIESTVSDGYTFGMFTDIEGNLIGLIEAFAF